MFPQFFSSNLDRVSRSRLSQKSLFKVQAWLHRFNLFPKASVKVVVVGGTNGKGTTCFALEALAQQRQKRVGLFSSPHLLSINERIRIYGAPISMEALTRIEEIFCLEAPDFRTELTFFERMFLVALRLFKEQDLDLWIIEVGLGGQFCATNSLDADLTVLTTIDLDHTEILGDNREIIGQEKSGIFRPDTPVILAERHPPQSVLRRVAALKAPRFQMGQEWDLVQEEDFSTHFRSIHHADIYLADLMLPAESIGAAIIADEYLHGKMALKSLVELLKDFKVMGRFQEIAKHPFGFVDVAHNPQSFARLKKMMIGFGERHHLKKWYLIFSMLQRKALKESLEPFKEEKQFAWILPEWGAADQFFRPEEIRTHLTSSEVFMVQGIESAIELARFRASQEENSAFIAAGSFLTVAAVLKHDPLSSPPPP